MVPIALEFQGFQQKLRVGISIMSVRRFVHIEFLAHCDVIEQIQYGFIHIIYASTSTAINHKTKV